MLSVGKFNVGFTRSALKQLRLLLTSVQLRITDSINARLVTVPYIADGKHIKKLTNGYRLRVGEYRVFYVIESKDVIIKSVVRRTSKTY